MFEAAGEAIARARRGEGPTLIEAKTYRFYGHEEGDAATYRTEEEVEAHRARDPITSLGRQLETQGVSFRRGARGSAGTLGAHGRGRLRRSA